MLGVRSVVHGRDILRTIRAAQLASLERVAADRLIDHLINILRSRAKGAAHADPGAVTAAASAAVELGRELGLRDEASFVDLVGLTWEFGADFHHAPPVRAILRARERTPQSRVAALFELDDDAWARVRGDR